MFYLANRFFPLVVFIILNSLFTSAFASKRNIAVLVPLEHEAMVQITSGIKQALTGSDVDITIQNAQGDANIQLSLIKQMKDSDVYAIMPIGTAACQMTISHITDKRVVCVATSLPIDHNKYPLATSLNDEIPITISIAKLPMLRNIAVIYSANEKIAPEVEELKKYAKENNITLHLSMIQTLIDLPTAIKTAPEDIQAFLILKDHMIVSAASSIAGEAEKRSIPLIASDEGSVKNGATIAIGVKEQDIGIKSGEIVKSILAGTSPADIPSQTITDLTLFVNKQSMAKQKILNKEDLINLGFPVTEILKGQ
jgi:putative ABC transport system substrate-binding protein